MTVVDVPHVVDDADALRALDEVGVCVVADVLTPTGVASLRARLVDQGAGERRVGVAMSFLGPLDTCPSMQYVYGLVHKGEVFRDLAVHPRALRFARHALGDELLLYSFTGNAVAPGTPRGLVHTDQGFMPPDTPWPVVFNVIYMLDDFTADNGATRVVPGSHRRDPRDATPERFDAESVPAIGAAGSALLVESRVWHATGANRTTDDVRHGILAAYCRPFLRTQSNWLHTTPPELVRQCSWELRALLGYKTGLGVGGLQGMHGVPAEELDFAHDDEIDGPDPAGAPPDPSNAYAGWIPARPVIVGELDGGS
jgi:ectoine hydroxylase-related dioxygenase (phytanoyl-CoA dioxygenase family)